MIVKNCINNSDGVLSPLPNKKKRITDPNKKHVTQIYHYFTPSGDYDGSNIAYHLSYQHKWNYINTNIYQDTEFNWLIPSFERKSSVIRGAHVYYRVLNDRRTRKNRPTSKAVDYTKTGRNIIIHLDEPSLSIDYDDKEYFRMRSCIYNENIFPCPEDGRRGIHWLQKQNRPCLYVDSHDVSGVFDDNTYWVYLSINKIRAELVNHIKNIVFCEHINKKENVRKFVRSLYIYTMWLYYINTSWGWKFENMNYEVLWNLAMYILQTAQPFEPSQDSPLNWLPFVKVTEVRYLFEKRVYNGLGKGLRYEYDDIAKWIPKETRYSFPKGYDKFSREMFKTEFKRPMTFKETKKLERNELIKELKKQGLSTRDIALKVGCSVGTVSSVKIEML